MVDFELVSLDGDKMGGVDDAGVLRRAAAAVSKLYLMAATGRSSKRITCSGMQGSRASIRNLTQRLCKEDAPGTTNDVVL